jgi:hypothetical protein
MLASWALTPFRPWARTAERRNASELPLERLKHIYVCGKGRTSDKGLQLPLEELGPDRRPHPPDAWRNHVGDRDPPSRPCGLRNPLCTAERCRLKAEECHQLARKARDAQTAEAQDREMIEQRYRPDDRGADWQDLALMMIVVVMALGLAVAALWIGLR